MKRTLFVMMMLGVATAVQAQPTITTVNMPAVGDSVRIAICTGPQAAGPSGANQTWDMSALAETQERYFKFMTPAQTPWGALFAGADVCGRSWDSSYTYYKTSGGALEQMGICLLVGTQPPPNDTVKSVYGNSDKLFNLPLAYGNSQTDNFSGTDFAMGFSVAFTGTITSEADGHGTLVLPTGTYNNVLRYHFTDVKNSGAVTITKEQWGWISPGHRFWLLLIETVQDGFGTSHTVWYNKQPHPVGIADVKRNTIAISPNPVTAGGIVNLDWNKREAASLRLLGCDGRVVLSRQVALQQGNNSLAVPGDVAAGVYLLELRTADGVYQQRIFVR